MKESSKPGLGTGVATAHSFEDETSPAIQEQLARLTFAESKIDFRGRSVLDFGCGTGYNCFYLSERQSPSQVVGIDIVESSVAYCKEHYATDRTEYHVRDCLVHDPSLGKFDVVLSCEVIEHVPDQDRFLEVLGLSLSESGVAFISTPNRALFSLTKSRSFNNKTHIKELYYDEFEALLKRHFGSVELYSQRHNERFHEAYVNQLSLTNVLYALRHEYLGEGLKARIARKLAKVLIVNGVERFGDASYPNPKRRRYTDFEFTEGRDDHGVWTVAICRNPLQR